jgi:tetratricopeptide (TPR) repeat protein
VVSLHVFPAGERISGAAVATVAYLGKILWPASLSVHYPRLPGGPGLAVTIGALLLLLLACAATIRLARRLPFLVTGGGWYVVALTPVIGLVQVGDQAMADRYTYVPSIGLFLAGVWLLRDFTRTRPRLRTALVVAGCITVCSWSVATSRHLRVWANSGTLLTHSLRVTPNSWLLHFVYGTVLRDGGEAGKAIEQFQEAVALRPLSAETHFNLGLAYDDRGDAAHAIQAYREALRLKPDYAEAHNNLGAVYGREGDFGGAVEHFRAAVALQPDLPGTRQNLAQALRMQAQSGNAPR